MPLIEISQWIEDNSSWTIGTDFFVGALPLEIPGGAAPPVRCLVALWRGGDAEGQLPDRMDAQIELLSRAEDYYTAYDDSMALHELLHGTHGWNLPVVTSGEVWLAMVVDALGLPQPIANPDTKGHFVFSGTYIWMLERESC